jgi:hypothetical protein
MVVKALVCCKNNDVSHAAWCSETSDASREANPSSFFKRLSCCRSNSDILTQFLMILGQL